MPEEGKLLQEHRPSHHALGGVLEGRVSPPGQPVQLNHTLTILRAGGQAPTWVEPLPSPFSHVPLPHQSPRSRTLTAQSLPGFYQQQYQQKMACGVSQ